MPRRQFLKLTMENNNNKKRIQRVNAVPRKLSLLLCQSALFSKFNNNNNKRRFSCEIISDLETTFQCKLPSKKSTSRLEIALQTLRTCKLMKNLFCVVILKILLSGLTFLPACFLREFPVASEFLFKINLNGQNHLCTDGM